MRYYHFKNDTAKKIPIGKLVCLARTYKKHAEEMHAKIPTTPLLFLKPSTSVIFSGDFIQYPKQSQCLHHEVELGVLIGKNGKNILKEDAKKHILGYCVGLDITARDIQTEAKKQGYPWSISKGFDTFAPISDIIVRDEIKNPNNLDLQLSINGSLRQKTNTSKMIWSVEELISYISEIMTLEPGDLILTGTPEGVGEIKKGDILTASLGLYCSLTTTVA